MLTNNRRYVAITRAKKQLIVPPKVAQWLKALATLLRCSDDQGDLRDPLPVQPTAFNGSNYYLLPPFTDTKSANNFKHRRTAVPQLFDMADLKQLVADIALALRSECQKSAYGVPRLTPSLPGDLSAEDVAGVTGALAPAAVKVEPTGEHVSDVLRRTRSDNMHGPDEAQRYNKLSRTTQ